jgi:hypothetical protein
VDCPNDKIKAKVEKREYYKKPSYIRFYSFEIASVVTFTFLFILNYYLVKKKKYER